MKLNPDFVLIWIRSFEQSTVHYYPIYTINTIIQASVSNLQHVSWSRSYRGRVLFRPRSQEGTSPV